MRKRFGQSLRIGVSSQGLALLKCSRWGGNGPELVAELALPGAGIDAIGAGLRQLLQDAGCAGWPATLVLADGLARVWQVTPPQGSARLADLEAAAALRFQGLFGDSAAGWTIAAGWSATEPFIAAALPRQLLAQLRQAAAGQQVGLVEIVPQFVAGWNQWRAAIQPGAWYGLVQHGVLTLGAVDGGQVRAVRPAALPDGAGLDWLAQHVAREALRLNLAPPARLQLSGQAPAAWSGAGPLACALLDAGQGGQRSPAAALAFTGIRS